MKNWERRSGQICLDTRTGLKMGVRVGGRGYGVNLKEGVVQHQNVVDFHLLSMTWPPNTFTLLM